MHRVDTFVSVLDDAIPCGIDDISIIADTATEAIVARASIQGVVTSVAKQRVVARSAREGIIGAVAGKHIGEGVARAIDGGCAN